MRHLPPRQWLSWRITRFPTQASVDSGRLPAFQRRDLATMSHQNLQPLTIDGDRPDLRAERPGPDGVRHALVDHVRKLIAAGRYDTPERWAAAEAGLFQTMDEK